MRTKIFILALMMLGFTAGAWAQNNGKVYEVVEVAPQFPGGTSALMSYLSSTVTYPKEAEKQDIEGRVIIQFIVEKDGSVSNANVIRGAHPLLDAEALRVINAMPKWEPGKQKGEAVRVKFNVPINFKLDKKKKTV